MERKQFGPISRNSATKKKKGKCTSCISRGTISRSSLESRIRFLPSSMLAILALWSPPGTAVAGTPDTPPANAPIPATFVGIVAVCFFIFSFFFLFFISVFCVCVFSIVQISPSIHHFFFFPPIYFIFFFFFWIRTGIYFFSSFVPRRERDYHRHADQRLFRHRDVET